MWSSTTHPTKSSIALLDPLRAFAAWAVIAWHLSEFAGYRMPFFSSAAFAVDIFMNISGFLMMYHYVLRRTAEPWESPRTWGRFIVRRFFRIAPLYYLLLLLACALRMVPALQPVEGAEPLSFGRFLFMHFTFLFGLFPSYQADNIIPDWSLSLEMQFYAVFPFLALLINRVGTAAFFFVCCLISAAANLLISFYVGTPPGVLGWFPQPSFLPLKLHVFAVGTVAAAVYFNGPRELRSWWYLPSFVLFGLTCVFNYTRLLGALYWLLFLCVLIPTTASWLKAALQRTDEWCQRLGWFHWPAELSYSGYLIHGIVFVLIFGGPAAHRISTGHFALLYAAMLLLVGAIGVPLYLLIERPGVRMGKFLLRRKSEEGK